MNFDYVIVDGGSVHPSNYRDDQARVPRLGALPECQGPNEKTVRLQEFL